VFILTGDVFALSSGSKGIEIMQISAGVDLSMAVSTTGTVYSWGKADGGRLGLHLARGTVATPRPVQLENSKGERIKAIDAECGFVHSLIVALDGTLYQCGGVGIDGAADGQQEQVAEGQLGKPVQVKDFNIWHRLHEPTEIVKTERWKKYGKYEVKGRSQMI
jgi:alpha-tubulin suppressor-like RCC1 family protein